MYKPDLLTVLIVASMVLGVVMMVVLGLIV